MSHDAMKEAYSDAAGEGVVVVDLSVGRYPENPNKGDRCIIVKFLTDANHMHMTGYHLSKSESSDNAAILEAAEMARKYRAEALINPRPCSCCGGSLPPEKAN